MREPRPIDAYSLSDEVFESKKDNPHSDSMVRRTHDHEHELFLKMIALAPTIDAVPVVRCKDCKHYHAELGWCDEHSHFIDEDRDFCYPHESTEWKMFEPNDFCSYGERKDGEG